jgi:hypothetical protein
VTDTRLTLRQAAAVLSVSESAIRKRVERGTLRSDKGADGRRYVYLDTGADRVEDEGADASATPEHDELISELRTHNDTLREQLEAERQAHAEARRIIAGLVERIPALEAPTDSAPNAPGSPVRGEDVGDRDNVLAETQHVDEATNTGEVKNRKENVWAPRRQAMVAFAGTVVSSLITLLDIIGTSVSTGGGSLSAIISSVWTAFSTALSSGLSSISGDQVVTIVSAIITVIGSIAATYLGIRWGRRRRNQ